MFEKVTVYNATTGETRIEQVEIEDITQEPPIPQEPTLEERILKIESDNQTQDELINISLLATDEMYMMIEPLLQSVPQTISERMVSKMVDMYVAMVIRGLKTIEEVPARYREEVKETLSKLEK